MTNYTSETSSSWTTDFTSEVWSGRSSLATDGTTQSTSSTTDDPGGDDSNIGAIVGGVIGVVILLAGIGILIFFLVTKRDRLATLCRKDQELAMDAIEGNSHTNQAFSEGGQAMNPMPVPKGLTVDDHSEAQMQPSTDNMYSQKTTIHEDPNDNQVEYTNAEAIARHSDQYSNSRPTSSKHSSHHSNDPNQRPIHDTTGYDDNMDSIPLVHAPSPFKSQQQQHLASDVGIFDDIYDHPTSTNNHRINDDNGSMDTVPSEDAPIPYQKDQNNIEGIMDDIYDHPKHGVTDDSMPVELAPFPYSSYNQENEEGIFEDIYDHPQGGKKQVTDYTVDPPLDLDDQDDQGEGIFEDLYDRPKLGNIEYVEDNLDSIPPDIAPPAPDNHIDNEDGEGIFEDIYDHPKGKNNRYIEETLDSIPQESAPPLPTSGDNNSDSDEYDYPKHSVPPEVARKTRTLPHWNDTAYKPTPKVRTLPVNSQLDPSSASHEHPYGNIEIAQRNSKDLFRPHKVSSHSLHKASGVYVNVKVEDGEDQ